MHCCLLEWPAGFVINTLTRNRYIALVDGLHIIALPDSCADHVNEKHVDGSGVATIARFSIYIFVTHKNLGVKISANITAQLVLGLAFIFSTGMPINLWLGRLNSLSDAALPMATSPPSLQIPQRTRK